MRSFHSSRLGSSSNDLAATSEERRMTHAYKPANAPIREESREVLTRVDTLTEVSQQRQTTTDDVEREYVVQNQILGDQAHIEKADAAGSGVKHKPTVESPDRAQEPVKAEEKRKVSANTVETTGNVGRDISGSQATMSKEFSRQFVFADDDEAAGEVAMHNAWSLEETKREKVRVDAVLAETLQASAVNKQQVEKDEKGAVTTTEQLDQAAKELSNYAMKVAIRSDSDDFPLSETVIRAAAAVTVSLLNQAIRDELHELPACGSASNCGAYQIKWAALIVTRVLQAAASRKTTEDVHLRWTAKILRAAILLVEDILSMIIIYVSRGGDVGTAQVWTPSAIRATCRIIDDVTDEAARQASAAKKRAMAQRHPTRPISQLPTSDADDAARDQLALEQEAAGRSAAILDNAGQQPSLLVMEPYDIIAVNGSNNNVNNNTTQLDLVHMSSPPTADRRSEAATATDNVNANNRAAEIRGSGGRLRQLFGRRRRNV